MDELVFSCCNMLYYLCLSMGGAEIGGARPASCCILLQQ